MEELTSFGWHPFFEAAFAKFSGKGFEVGRVMLEHRKTFRLWTQFGEISALTSGRLHHTSIDRAGLPAVGDWVVFRYQQEENKGIIHSVLPRKSKFSRKTAGLKTEEQIIAANIDIIFLVASLSQRINVRGIERYLTLAWDSGASPVIVMNKKDLCGDPGKEILRIESAAFGTPVLAISAFTNDNVSSLLEHLEKGRTGALLGPSGVGKSTILNQLFGKEIQDVREVREIDNKGRHTTTHRELFLLPSGALMIDTPGMRELQLWEGGEGLEEAFNDIQTLAKACRFRDCRHDDEPGCAVVEALQNEGLKKSRYLSFKKLQKEMEHLATRQDERAMLDAKKKNKRLHKEIRRMYKRK